MTDRHLSELQIAAALRDPTIACAVPGCTRCADRLAEARAIARRFHDEVLPRTLPAITERTRPPARRWLPWLAVPVMAVAVAAVLFVVVPAREEATPVLASKGGAPATASIVVRRGDAAEPVLDGTVLHPGDAIRFVVDPMRASYALVVSIDGAGSISVYAPLGGATSLEVPRGVEPWPLPDSVVLDATLGVERIWIVLSAAPITVEELRPALERIAAGGAIAVQASGADELLAPRARVTVVSWWIDKR